MEKFCKYCGKKIPSDSVVCPKCGRQVNFEKTKKTNQEKENNNNIKEEQKFYAQKWFMWLMLILFSPVGILLMWKFHPELKKNTKIILTIIFALIFIIAIFNLEDENSSNNNNLNTNESTIKDNNVSKENPTTKDDNNTSTDEEKTKENERISKAEYIKKCKSIKFKNLARNPDKYKGTKVKITGEVIQVSEGLLNSVDLRVNMTKDEYGYWDDTIYVQYYYKDNGIKILEDDIITLYGEVYGSYSYTSVLGATVTLPKINAEYIYIK